MGHVDVLLQRGRRRAQRDDGGLPHRGTEEGVRRQDGRGIRHFLRASDVLGCRAPSFPFSRAGVSDFREARRRWSRCARKRCGAPDDGSRFGSSRRLPGLEGRRARCFGRWPNGERPGGRSGQARSRAELDRFTPPVEDGGSFFEIPCIFPWARQEIVESSRAKPPREPTVGKAACSKNTHLARNRGYGEG